MSDRALTAAKRLQPDFRAVEVPATDHYASEETPIALSGRTALSPR